MRRGPATDMRAPRQTRASRFYEAGAARASRMFDAVSAMRCKMSMTSTASMRLQMPSQAVIGAQGIDRLVILPNNRIKATFDAFVAICIIFTSISMPIKSASPQLLPRTPR